MGSQTWLGLRRASLGSSSRGTGSQPLAPALCSFAAWDVLPHESRLPQPEVLGDRLETLAALLSAADDPALPAPVIVASAAALSQRTFHPDHLRRRLRRLRQGDTLDPLDLIEWLEDQAYEPEAQVTQRGELALRGGIVDVFPLTAPWPIRLEFFGNTLESLREFDPQTQMSRGTLAEAILTPAGELGLLRRPPAPTPGDLPGAPAPPLLAGLVDYLPPNAIILLSEPAAIDRQAQQYASQIPRGDPFFLPHPECRLPSGQQPFTCLELAEIAHPPPAPPDTPPPAADPPDLGLESLDAFRPLPDRSPETAVAETQRREFFAQLHRWLRQNHAVHVFCNNHGERQRFEEIWADYGYGQASPKGPPRHPSGDTASPGTTAPLQVHVGSLSRGWRCEPARAVVVTDAEIFGRYRIQRPRRHRAAHAPATTSVFDVTFTDLAPGDYVVHVQHGIARYLGLQRLPRAGNRRDAPSAADDAEECLALEFAPSQPDLPPPKLYVPITEAHLVSKYVGAGKGLPPLNVLGGSRWNKAKAQAARAVRDLAADLLALQAARAAQAGIAFPEDAPWQREFESAFLYEETPDQQKAIADTKRDLEAPKPMDRLICGDAGFGKTEVALRAAFKVVLAGKQVAVLVPTTVLAQQHYNTFRERMADYPIRIELLSRFRTRAEQAAVLDALAGGAVDIVIGTHRLVQPDVTFHDLGLVVIDEEQRFGVAHKERLKQLRRLVDVLTLSATPIPRTLYLALTGARDMSTIETPPHDRLPIETRIAPYNENLIREAIQRELHRGGQVFFLHNRIADIETVAARLRALVPQARIAVGHGQMRADDLEEVMTRFAAGDADVLLSTTIVESGIDIPNANTIFIDRADRFGLSDLYQLRGRVGRYKHQAYAYLLIPRHAGLLADARKRISAIRQFSTPGSGFKIAMRDLEIRGAGNLLGPEQSGHITAVGFELYCQLLKQSVAALKGEPLPPRIDVAVRLDFLDLNPAAPSPEPAPAADPLRASACLPLRYVPEPHHRIEIHRKLAQATDPRSLDAIASELRDRFGPLPPAAELLLAVLSLKLTAASRGLTAIETRGDKLLLSRGRDLVQAGGRFPRLTRRAPRARLTEIRRLILSLPPVPR